MSSDPGIALSLSRHYTPQGLPYQRLAIDLTRKDRIIEPTALAAIELPPGIDTTQGVVITGRAPIWLYATLVHELHPTVWVACHDPRLGAVVVATHSTQVEMGQVIPLEQPTPTGLCPAVMVVGPPDSGKSVLSHALFQALISTNPNIYLQRANWDGEGNYVLELPPEIDAEIYKQQNKGGMSDRFFPDQAQAILELRRQKALVIVDVGGMVQPEKMPVLEACTHYIIISSDPEAIEPWHEFCRDRGNLIPIATIRSCLEETLTIHRQQPDLDLTCGPWERGRVREVPSVLVERVQGLMGRSGSR